MSPPSILSLFPIEELNEEVLFTHIAHFSNQLLANIDLLLPIQSKLVDAGIDATNRTIHLRETFIGTI